MNMENTIKLGESCDLGNKIMNNGKASAALIEPKDTNRVTANTTTKTIREPNAP